MLGILTPLEETRAYRDIADEVREKAIRDTIQMLGSLRDEGSLPEAAYRDRVKQLERDLVEIRARMGQT